MEIGQITVQAVNARLEMKNAIPKGQLEIHQEQPAVIVEITHGQLQIDSTECRAALGMKNSLAFAAEAAEKGKQAVLDGILRRNKEGQRMAAVQNKKDAFADLAQQRVQDPPVQIAITTLPKPNIEFIPSEIKMSLKTPPEKAVSIQYQPSVYEAQYIPGEMHIDIQT